jgi:hypothetical protein
MQKIGHIFQDFGAFLPFGKTWIKRLPLAEGASRHDQGCDSG